MRQFQTAYQDAQSFRETVNAWQSWRKDHGAGQALFHVLSDGADADEVRAARSVLEEVMPDAACIGASASGNLYEGSISTERLVVTCTVFEKPDSFFRTCLIPVENRDASVLRETLRNMKEAFSGVKAVEIIVTIDTIPIREVCRILEEEIPEGIPVWGGGAFGDNAFTAYVFEKNSEFNTNGVVMALMGGPDLHVMSNFVIGWRQLGSPMKVTRARGKILYELDGVPAYQVYEHYLKIPNDEHIFYNALEFPFAVNHGDGVLLRHALACNEDGSIDMSTDIPEGSIIHLTYGDPETILENVRSNVEQLRSFAPEVISVFDCFGRKTFWGGTEGSRETRPLNEVAPIYGFCTAGELIRWQGTMDHHNLSLVFAGMREGGPVERVMPDLHREVPQNESTMSMVRRLANFINTATAEVVEANELLSIMAITDKLTGLYNRGEIQRRITERIAECATDPVGENATGIIMIDLDSFKEVNDTYGHQEGDQVLTKVSALIREMTEELGNGAAGGRWGGEEFMILLPGMNLEESVAFAERLRKGIEAIRFPLCGKETASFGVAEARPQETEDEVVMRADMALYKAKRLGKNQVQTD